MNDTWRKLLIGGLVLACLGCTGRPSPPAEGDPSHEHDDQEHEGQHDDHEPGSDGHQAENDEHGPEGLVMLSAEALDRIELETAPAALRPMAETTGTTGEVGFDERRIAHVAPRLEGRLHRVAAELGEPVAGGQLLAVVDSVTLGEAKAATLRARARFEVADKRHRRQRELYADRIVSEQEALDAEAAMREAQADLDLAEQTLRLYGLSDQQIAELAPGAADSSLYPVRAPFAGKVVEKDAVQGELVEPSRTLFTIADLSTVWVWIDVYEKDLRGVAPGDSVEVRLDAWPGEVLGGRIAYLGDRLERESRTVRARVDLPNPEGRLRPGMFARVSLRAAGGPVLEVLAVPEDALQRHEGGSIVFVATGEGGFERRPVVTGRRVGGWVEVLGGLKPGEPVVTRGAFLLKAQSSGDQLGGHHHH